MSTIGISLGFDCQPAQWGVEKGLRGRRSEGYLTCPFDLMVTNYPGVVECIRDDFRYLTDSNYLELHVGSTETTIYNTKYKFAFNHESPGHADLYKKEEWPNGKEHFVVDDFKYLKERYNRRVSNFRNYINSRNPIMFILNRYNTRAITDVPELKNVLAEKYPNLKYRVAFICPHSLEYMERHIRSMGFTDNDEEIKNLYRKKNRGKIIQSLIGNKLRKIYNRKMKMFFDL